MENSTKALLIAASTLITIVLISIGIKLLSSTSGISEEVGSVSESMAVSVFNSQFTSYFSNSTTGAQARALVQKIIANNRTSSFKVLIYCPDYSNNHITNSNIDSFYAWIPQNANFKMQVFTGCGTYSGGYQSNGFIGCILIDKY